MVTLLKEKLPRGHGVPSGKGINISTNLAHPHVISKNAYLERYGIDADGIRRVTIYKTAYPDMDQHILRVYRRLGYEITEDIAHACYVCSIAGEQHIENCQKETDAAYKLQAMSENPVSPSPGIRFEVSEGERVDPQASIFVQDNGG